jgi:hypothetical protein
MQGYLSTDIQAFVAVVNTTLIDEVIVNNLIPLATSLNNTQANITSIEAQSSSISANQAVFATLVTTLNSGILLP